MKIALLTIVFLGINELTYMVFTNRTLNSIDWITMQSILKANIILILFINYVGNIFFNFIKKYIKFKSKYDKIILNVIVLILILLLIGLEFLYFATIGKHEVQSFI